MEAKTLSWNHIEHLTLQFLVKKLILSQQLRIFDKGDLFTYVDVFVFHSLLFWFSLEFVLRSYMEKLGLLCLEQSG